MAVSLPVPPSLSYIVLSRYKYLKKDPGKCTGKQIIVFLCHLLPGIPVNGQPGNWKLQLPQVSWIRQSMQMNIHPLLTPKLRHEK